MSSNNPNTGSGATEVSTAAIQTLTAAQAQTRTHPPLKISDILYITKPTGKADLKSFRSRKKQPGDRDDQTLGVDCIDNLPNLPFKLKGEKNYIDWKAHVDITLHKAGIPYLANSEKARPQDDDPLYKQWAHARDCLTGWLIRQMDTNTIRYFRPLRDDHPYADEFMALVRERLLGGMSMARMTLMKYCKMSRNDFTTTQAFFKAFEKTVYICNEFGLVRNWYETILRLTGELFNDLNIWVATYTYAKTNKAPKDFTRTDFAEACMNAISWATERDYYKEEKAKGK